MAVASFHRAGRQVTMRGFHPPKKATVTAWYRAAVTAWYRAAVGQIPSAPDWRTVDMAAAMASTETISWHGDGWDLFVARKRNLR